MIRLSSEEILRHVSRHVPGAVRWIYFSALLMLPLPAFAHNSTSPFVETELDSDSCFVQIPHTTVTCYVLVGSGGHTEAQMRSHGYQVGVGGIVAMQ